MKGFISFLIGVFLLVVVSVMITKSYYINPGNVGVMILKGGNSAKGVSETPVQPGWGFRKLFTEDVKEYPTYLQTAIWTKLSTEGSSNDDSITANSKEGVSINIDVTMSYTLEAAKVPDLYVKYRSDIASIQNTYLRQSVRQAVQNTFGDYSVEELYGPKKQEVAGKIQALLVAANSGDGFNITQFTINEIRLPDQVMTSINQKIQAGQDALKAEQVLKQTIIEAQQKNAKAKGDADARLTNAKAEAEAIKIQAAAIQSQGGADYVQLKAIEKWDGKLPTQFIPGQSVPFLNVVK